VQVIGAAGMRANTDLVITGEAAVLVPYRREHVEKYHGWMKDPFLQEMTASEPLTLEEEYSMQQSWAEDEDKCTFIVLDRSMQDVGSCGRHGGAMAGDTNLFFNDPDSKTTAEIEIMIAEASSRGKGLGREAARMMMAFAVSRLGVTRFVAKVGEANAPSLALFTRSLGFTEVSRSSVFKEVTLELAAEGEAGADLRQLAAQLRYSSFDDPH